MSRHALRSALGRAVPSGTARALTLPIRTTTPASFFSTTSTSASEGSNKNNNISSNDAKTNENTSSSTSSSSTSSSIKSRKPRAQSAAVQRLAQLNTTTTTNNSARGLEEVPGIPSSSGPRRSGSSSSSSSRPSAGGIDARSLRVSPDAAAAPGSGASGPRVLNLRSLRGGLRGRTPFGRGGGTIGRPRIGFGAGRGAIGGAATAGRFGAFGAGRLAGGARGGGGRLRARGRGDRQSKGAMKESDKETMPGRGKLVWNPEEQAVLDRLDKGEVVPHTPKLTRETLTGYGAAVATDAPIGPAETVLRNMRLMTGGMAFNSDSGVTTDLKEVMKRYFYKKPIFVHSKGEREWIESAYPKLRLVGPNEKIKKAILEPAVLGKYEQPKFADITDVKGTVANYHSRTSTYMDADSQKFIDKVLSLLPPQQGGKPAAQPQAKR